MLFLCRLCVLIDFIYTVYVFQKTPWASFTVVPFESCGWVKPQANCLLYNCGLKRCTLSKSSCCFMRWWTSSFSKSNTFPCCSIKRARFIWSQSWKVSPSEWNQMLLWAKHFRWGTLNHVISKSQEAKSHLICRGWLWMWWTMLAEGQNLNPRSSLNRKSQTRAKITPPNSAKSDTTFRHHGSPSVLRFTHRGQLTHPAGSEGDMFRY